MTSAQLDVCALALDEPGPLSLSLSPSPSPTNAAGRGAVIEDDSVKALHGIAHAGSVQALAVSDAHLFAGTQHGAIDVSAVLALLSVLTVSSDSTVRVWDARELACRYTLVSSVDIGDIFSVVFSHPQQSLFIAGQNTTIEWFDLRAGINQAETIDSRPKSRYTDFFEPRAKRQSLLAEISDEIKPVTGTVVQISPSSALPFAHHGYVYCLYLGHLPHSSDEYLFSGSGDGTVKIWDHADSTLTELHRLEIKDADLQVLCMAVIDSLLYTGLSDGYVQIWDLDTMQSVRFVKAHSSNIFSLIAFHDTLYTGSIRSIKQWSTNLICTEEWYGHNGKILSMSLLDKDNSGTSLLITGGSDHMLRIWPIALKNDPNRSNPPPNMDDVFLHTLSNFIALPTVSGSESNLEDCRRGATFLKNVLLRAGAAVHLLCTCVNGKDCNPVVLAKFKSNAPNSGKAKSVLFYGHYDIIAPGNSWTTNPYHLSGLDGYLYGRGISDNKGPVLAAIFAAAKLHRRQELSATTTFLIEGEEESGSHGFSTAIRENRNLIGDVDWILLSNSYWLDDERPCLTYGLRGIIEATVEVRSERVDLHSGVAGGSVKEPMTDLIYLLSKLTDPFGNVILPDFFKPVRPVSKHERSLYEAIIQTDSPDPSQEYAGLMAKWRYPSLTIHNITTSGPGFGSVIPHNVKAQISIRVVPDQQIDDIQRSLVNHLESEFNILKSCNKLKRVADWWLGDPQNRAFKVLETAVEREWGVKPLYIREGGSIPAVRYLEQEFGAEAVQFPMGQASDNAHLDNERLRVENLLKGRKILENALKQLGRE